MTQRKHKNATRRRFLKAAGAGVALFQIAPASILGGPRRPTPNEKINVACVGVGGRGRASVNGCASENIVGLCDVDDTRAAESFAKFPKAKRFRDFRIMLDELDGQIDAVTVGIPDHNHAVVVMEAIRRDKHVYCEKPLAHSIHEVRAMMEAADEHKVITQLGNQGHSFDDIRKFCEMVWDGAIGNVTEVHACCDAFRNVYCQVAKLPELAKKTEIPADLDYDLWLGPANYRPYSPLWVPWNWRGWMPFGTGCIGDWACHIIDPSFWALDLGAPTSVVAEVDPSHDPVNHADLYPPGVKLTYQFPAKGKRGPVKVMWFDGSFRPPRPKEMEESDNVPGVGAVVYGDKGTIVHQSHGAGKCRLLPESRMKDYKLPAESIPRVPGHHADWLEAIRTGRQAGSHFGYGGPLTEVGLLGAVAIRFPGKKLEWNTETMQFTNSTGANAYVHPPYRAGWSL